MSELHVVTWLWKQKGYHKGAEFTPFHVDVLRRQVARNLTTPHDFTCFTDSDPALFTTDVIVRPLPKLPRLATWVPRISPGRPNCYVRLWLTGPEAEQLFGTDSRVVTLDLDLVVTGELDSLYNRDEDFVIVRDWMHKLDGYNGSMWMVRQGSARMRSLWDQITSKTGGPTKRPYTGRGSDQAVLGALLPGAPTWTKADGVYSYKFDGLQRARSLPSGARVVIFHGRPSPWAEAAKVGWIEAAAGYHHGPRPDGGGSSQRAKPVKTGGKPAGRRPVAQSKASRPPPPSSRSQPDLPLAKRRDSSPKQSRKGDARQGRGRVPQKVEATSGDDDAVPTGLGPEVSEGFATEQPEQWRVAVVIGGGRCVWDDVARLRDLLDGRPWPGLVVAVNDVGVHWRSRLEHWVGFHGAKLLDWADERDSEETPILWAQHVPEEGTYRIKPPSAWAGGASGLLAGYVMRERVDCSALIYCGVPMSRTPHFEQSRAHSTADWAANAYWNAWKRPVTADLLREFARSMSGRTRRLFGEPTREWIGEILQG